jgi:hypothetical protein
MKSEMKELADQVREYFPFHPRSALKYFRLSYPHVIAATIVSMVWSYLELEMMERAGLFKFTRPMELNDLQILQDSHSLN